MAYRVPPQNINKKDKNYDDGDNGRNGHLFWGFVGALAVIIIIIAAHQITMDRYNKAPQLPTYDIIEEALVDANCDIPITEQEAKILVNWLYLAVERREGYYIGIDISRGALTGPFTVWTFYLTTPYDEIEFTITAYDDGWSASNITWPRRHQVEYFTDCSGDKI